MKIYYQCEICGRSYDNTEQAKACEARPTPVTPPPGVIFGNATKDTFYHGITFATAAGMKILNHNLYGSLWACRDHCGDSVGKDTCGNGFWSGFDGKDAPDPGHPTFKRLVEALKYQGIQPLVWNGEKVVSLTKFLKK